MNKLSERKINEGLVELDKRLTRDLAKIAVFFQETYGFPIDVFKEEMKKRISQPRLNFWKFVLNFKKDHPEIF